MNLKFKSKMNLLFIVLTIFLTKCQQSSFLQLNPSQNISYRIVVGDKKYQQLQKYFSGNQQCSISMVNNQKKQTKMCQVFRDQNTIQATTLNYFYVNDDYQRYTSVIYKYEDVLHLKNALDIIVFQKNIIVFFEHGDAIFYNMDNKKNFYEVKRINVNNNEVDEGNFIIIRNQCLYFSTNKVYRFYGNYSVSEVSGYQPTKHQFQLAKAHNNDYVAIVGNGVAHYLVLDDKLQFVKYQKIVGMNEKKNQQIPIEVIDIQFDASTGTFYYLDENQGLFKAKTKINEDEKVMANSTGFTEDSCENLILFQGYLFMTCPNLFKYDLLTQKTDQCLEKVQLIANQILVNNSKLYLFSEKSYLIYQPLTKKVQRGFLPEFSNRLAFFEEYFIIINDFMISTAIFYYGKCYLYCTSDEKVIGMNMGNISITGACVDYKQPKIGGKTQCKVKLGINVEVYVHQTPLHILEIVGIMIVIWLIVAGSIWYCVRNIQVHKEYNVLQEEAEGDSKNQEIQKSEKSKS